MKKNTILNEEEKKEIMKQMKSDSKVDFVDVIIEMKKKTKEKIKWQHQI